MLRILTTLLLSFIVLTTSAFAEGDKDKFHLYLLVGQSNMAGRGKVAESDRTPHPRLKMLNKAGKWVPATDPLHFDKSVAGVGLGKTFGTLAAEADKNITVGLIPCAAGGSPISTWEVGGYHGQTKSHPYDDAIRRAKLAMKTGTLKGILWHQGESDAKPKLSNIYEQKLHELIGRFRKELKAETVPFIAGQMGQFPERPWNEYKKQIDKVHQDLPKKVEHTAFADSNELTHKGDQVHFDSKSYRELGRRYFAAFQTIK